MTNSTNIELMTELSQALVGESVPTCKKCGSAKRRRKDSHAKSGWRWRCPSCVLASNAKLREADPGYKERFNEYKRRYNRETKNMAGHVARTYGMTLDDYRALRELQGGHCALCSYELTELPSMVSHIDHCHSSGAVRGLLCTNCNRGLGFFRDNPLLLQKAIAYLNGGNQSLVDAVLHSADERDRDGAA